MEVDGRDMHHCGGQCCCAAGEASSFSFRVGLAPTSVQTSEGPVCFSSVRLPLQPASVANLSVCNRPSGCSFLFKDRSSFEQ
jgi:predicted RNA-binding Zn ribbon-like protein